MRTIMLLLGAVLLTTCSTIKAASSSVVTVYCDSGAVWQGEGVAVSPYHVLTAEHIVQVCTGRVYVDGNPADVQVHGEAMASQDEANDWALLYVSDKSYSYWATPSPDIAHPGNSGMPLFDAKGRYVGFVAAGTGLKGEARIVTAGAWGEAVKDLPQVNMRD